MSSRQDNVNERRLGAANGIDRRREDVAGHSEVRRLSGSRLGSPLAPQRPQWPTFEEKMLRLWKEDMDVLKVEGGEAFYIKLEKDKEASDTADLPRGVLSSLTKKSMIEPQTTWPLVPPHPHGNTF